MKIIKIRAINGPSVFHNRPVLLTRIHLGDLSDSPSNNIPGFTAALVKMLPGLMKHFCSPGHYGGFHERLIRGTYMAHILEHVALEFSELCGIGVSYGKTVFAGLTGQYDIATRFLNEEGMKGCVWAAFDLLNAILKGEKFSLEERVESIREIVEETKMGPSTQAIFDAAVARGIPCHRLGKDSLLRFGYGKKLRHVQASITDRTSNLAVELAQDKALTKELLEQAGIAVPRCAVVDSKDAVASMIPGLGFPLVVKPLDGNHGNGVSLNLMTEEEALFAYDLARKFSTHVLLEEMCAGRDYRVLVIGGKLAAAAERIPPVVTGNGESTISELITRLNLDPRRGYGHCGVLTKIEINELVLQSLTHQHLQLNSVPAQGRVVFLREN
ncbi:MAG: cyanophycin synthetase family protein, partial [Bdellovibrionota bacterium]